MKKGLIVLFAVFLLIHIVNIVSHFVIVDRTSYEPVYGLAHPFSKILYPWINFDGQNYLKIVLSGYDLQNVVFFPFFPLMVNIFSLNGVINPIIAGLFLSFTCALFSAIGLYDLTRKEYGNKIALRAGIILFTFPTSFFMFAFYNESLFLLITILFFWFLRKNNYLLASMCVIFAGLTRIFALALFAPLVFTAISRYQTYRKFSSGLVVAPLGFMSYLFYIWVKFGDPLLVVKLQSVDRFSRHLDIFSPIYVARETFLKVYSGPQANFGSPFVYPIIIVEFLAITFGIIMLILTYKKLAMDYWIYCLFYMLIILFSGGLSSDLRYILMVFPYFIFLAMKLSNFWYKLWIASSLTLLVLFSSLFFRNYWVA